MEMEMEMEDMTSTVSGDEGGRQEERAEAVGMEAKERDNEDETYARIQPTEDVYQTALLTTPPRKHQASVPNFRLFRSLAAILSIVCLVLLAVIVALAIKLQTQTICPEEVDGSVVSVCSRDQCGSLYTQRQVHACSCQECGEGWTEFQGFCFFLSRTRNTWLDSRADCQSKGGDLAVIDQDSIKTFLSQKAKDLYWIGLRRSDTHWTWVDHSAAGPGNWSTKPGQDCVYMDGNAKASRSWKTEDCSSVTYYICQKTR